VLLTRARRDIAEKHSSARYSITAGHGGARKPSDEGVIDMTSAVVNKNGELHEMTLDELDQAGGGLLPLLALAPYFLGGLAVGAGIGYLLFVR
jgi:hypothetical protein